MSQQNVSVTEDPIRLRQAIQKLSALFGAHTHVPGDIALASAKIIVGNSSGVGAAVSSSGDVTNDNAGAFTIANDAVSNAKMANMAEERIKGRAVGAGTGDPVDLTPTEVLTIIKTVDGPGSGLDADLLDGMSSAAFAAAAHTHTLADITDDGTMAAQNANNVTITGGSISGITDLAIADGGTGAGTATAAFDALAPTTTQGDIIYHNGTDNVRLAKGTASQVLAMNSGATAPEWVDPASGSDVNAMCAAWMF